MSDSLLDPRIKLHKSLKIGEYHINNQGCRFKIIDYLSYDKCTIQFEDDTMPIYENINYHNILTGAVKNDYLPIRYKTGFIGKGIYNTLKDKKAAQTWSGMLERCYDQKRQLSQPTYKDCSVTKEWHNFQNFAAWYEKNYIDGYVLDKDILKKGNKIYSPETCCFVPQEINNLFTNRSNYRNNLPIGVTTENNNRTFRTTFTKNKKQIYLGSFKTPEEAFQAYKIAKEVYIKEVAELWKSRIANNVYEALINYNVEITD